MSAICDSLRPYWLQGINEITGKTTTSFRAWLTDGQYVFHGKTQNTPLSFYTAVPDTLIRSFAQDINRMAIASFETIHGIPSNLDIPRSTAWPLIRSYYAAFFAAHAICRIFGVSVSQIYSEQSKNLSKAIATSSSELSVQQGLHRVDIDSVNNCFSIDKLPPHSHEETWKQFGSLLDRLLQNILTNPPSVPNSVIQDTSTVLYAILEIIQTTPCHKNYNWLSHMRNELTYQHLHGAWYPHERASRFRENVSENIISWKKDPIDLTMMQKEPLARFSQGCALIVSLMRELIEDVALRNPNDDSFLSYGALRVLRQCN